jgi:quinol monooxygenase YgiN
MAMGIEWPAVPMPTARGDPQCCRNALRTAECRATRRPIMAAPFIFIGTHKVKPGKLEEFKAWFADYIETTIEPDEPRLLSFNAYVNPEASEVTVVQVHPDAESMVHHLSVISEHVARAYVDFLERESRLQIYGTPHAGVMDLIQQMAGSAEPLTSQEPFAGFSRLGNSAAVASR